MASSSYPTFTTPVIASGDLPGYEQTPLPSFPTTSVTGSLPSGGGGIGGDGGGGFGAGDAAGLAAAGIPLLFSLFGSNKNKANAEQGAAGLTDLAKSMATSGKDLTGMGKDALSPVLSYLAKVVGGDPAALLEATAPERAKVMDQYATAKKSLAFTPRGGGQASAVANLEANKARDLSTLTSEARRSGVSTAAQLGATLTGQGTQASSAAASASEQAARLYAGLGQQDAQEHASLGASIGKFVGAALPFLLAL